MSEFLLKTAQRLNFLYGEFDDEMGITSNDRGLNHRAEWYSFSQRYISETARDGTYVTVTF